MSKSIITDDMQHCYLCHTPFYLHVHHIFYGTHARKMSEKYGLKIPLCVRHHTSDMGVHFNSALDEQIKIIAQKKAMEHYNWTKEDFINIFGRSFI